MAKKAKTQPAPHRGTYLLGLAIFCNHKSVLKLIREAIDSKPAVDNHRRLERAMNILNERGGEALDAAQELDDDDLNILAKGVVIGAAMVEKMTGHLSDAGSVHRGRYDSAEEIDAIMKAVAAEIEGGKHRNQDAAFKCVHDHLGAPSAARIKRIWRTKANNSKKYREAVKKKMT